MKVNFNPDPVVADRETILNLGQTRESSFISYRPATSGAVTSITAPYDCHILAVYSLAGLAIVSKNGRASIPNGVTGWDGDLVAYIDPAASSAAPFQAGMFGMNVPWKATEKLYFYNFSTTTFLLLVARDNPT